MALEPGSVRMAGKDVLEVNLSGIEVRKGAARVPEGRYPAKVKSCEMTTFKSGSKGLKWEFSLTDPKYKGSTFYHNNVLFDADGSPAVASLWSFRAVLEALGLTIKDSMMKIPLNKLVGRTCALDIVDGEYEGKVRSQILAIVPLSELEEEDETEDETEDEDEDEFDLE